MTSARREGMEPHEEVSHDVKIGGLTFADVTYSYSAGRLVRLTAVEAGDGSMEALEHAISQQHGPGVREPRQNTHYRWIDGPIVIYLAPAGALPNGAGTRVSFLEASFDDSRSRKLEGSYPIETLLMLADVDSATLGSAGAATFECAHPLSEEQTKAAVAVALEGLGHRVSLESGQLSVWPGVMVKSEVVVRCVAREGASATEPSPGHLTFVASMPPGDP